MEHLSKTKLSYFKELLQKKSRRTRQEFLVEGVRLCLEALRHPQNVNAIIYTERLNNHEQGNELISIAQNHNIPLYLTNEESLDKLTETCTPQSVVACVQQKKQISNDDFFQAERFLVLVDISDPGNIGTLLRTAEAFGWTHIVCIGETAEIYNPKIIRSSMGAIFRLSIIDSDIETCMNYFKKTQTECYFTMPHGGNIPIQQITSPKIALFLGSEAHGLPTDCIKNNIHQVKIPMNPVVESLNVAIAGGILLYLLRDTSKTID